MGADDLAAEQDRLAAAWQTSILERPLVIGGELLIAGCFVAFARGEAGPGAPGDRAWAAAVAWRTSGSSTAGAPAKPRSSGQALKGIEQRGTPRQALDVAAQAVAAGRVGARYSPGLLALREGPILATALEALIARGVRPDVVMVDATGRDHPRRAGLAVHLGAVFDFPSVGVTHRSLLARGEPPAVWRGSSSPAMFGDEQVGFWVRTRRGAKPVLAHAGWRCTPQTAARVVVMASSDGARTPIPLQEARRVAREARALADGSLHVGRR